MQFVSRLLLCSFDVVSFSKKFKMASSRKRVAVAAAANYDSREDMPDLVVAGPSGGPASTRPAGGEVLLREFGGAGGLPVGTGGR